MFQEIRNRITRNLIATIVLLIVAYGAHLFGSELEIGGLVVLCAWILLKIDEVHVRCFMPRYLQRL